MNTTTQAADWFDHVPAYAGDPILTLAEDFQRDPRPNKAGLSIGIYFDEQGRLPVLEAVREAQTALAQDSGPCPYQPMEGAAEYRRAAQELVFGALHEAVASARIATLQTLGGSGALKVGADFIARHFTGSEVWISDPSWENHRVLFEGAGLRVHTYPYYDEASGGLRFDAMCAALNALPRRSVVLLHASCHNPTGVDLAAAQWAELITLFRQRELIPFIDMAYQGFGDGIDEDAHAVREFAAAGLPCFVANSFSKNFSLYGERCGALHVVCPRPAQVGRVLGQLKLAVRGNYSSPPTHGARIVARVLRSPTLRASWESELAAMRKRIKGMRAELFARLSAGLHEAGVRRELGFYLTQRGMFSYTGLSAAQVDHLREKHAVYLVRSGRMCMSGLTPRNVEAVARALVQTMV